MVRGWNLSYACLTGFNARQALRNMKDTDPEFWNELTMKTTDSVSLPDEDLMTPEDESLLAAELEDEDLDDSDVTTKTVIASILDKKLPKGTAARESGSLMLDRAAESLDDIDEPVGESDLGTSSGGTSAATVDEMGPGKRKRKPNTLYREFWRHNDSDDSDVEPEEWRTTCERLFHNKLVILILCN